MKDKQTDLLLAQFISQCFTVMTLFVQLRAHLHQLTILFSLRQFRQSQLVPCTPLLYNYLSIEANNQNSIDFTEETHFYN